MSDAYWPDLWRELSDRFRWPEARGSSGWREDRARHFDAASKRKSAERPDPLLDFLLENLEQDYTVLDIGAGTGRFAVPMAKVAREVTAIEPSSSMSAFLLENAAAEGVSNIRLVEAGWEDVEVERHDVAFCSHAMYINPDLVGFRSQDGGVRQGRLLPTDASAKPRRGYGGAVDPHLRTASRQP